MSADDLAAAVKSRRAELGLTQAAVRRLGGPSTETVRLIENGRTSPLRPMTLGQIDTAMGWEPGSALRALRDGETPIAAEPLLTSEDERALRIGRAVLTVAGELYREFGRPQ